MKSMIPFKIYLRTVEAVLLDIDLEFEENSMKTDIKSVYTDLIELYEYKRETDVGLSLNYSITRLLEILDNASNKFNKTLRDNGVEEEVVIGIGESKEEILSDIEDIEDDIIKDLKEFIESEDKTLEMLRDAFKGEFITMPNFKAVINKEFLNKNIRDIKTEIGSYDKDFKKHLLEYFEEISSKYDYNYDYDYFTDYDYEYEYDCYYDSDFDEDLDDYFDDYDYDYDYFDEYEYDDDCDSDFEYEYKGKRYDISYLFCLEDEGNPYKLVIEELEDNTKELLGDLSLIRGFNREVWLLRDSVYLEDTNKLRSVIIEELGK